jgi:uncharacterized membrane protein YuzA (DUF378 family)
MAILSFLSYLLIIVGALNWGLVGLFNVDLVVKLCGEETLSRRLLYIIIGLAAVLHLMLKLR